MSAMSRADSLSASSPAPLNTSPKLELPQSAAMKQTTTASSAGTTSQAVDSAAVDGTAVADITSPHELTNWVIDRWPTLLNIVDIDDGVHDAGRGHPDALGEKLRYYVVAGAGEVSAWTSVR